MGLWADTINKVYEVMVAESGSGQALSYLKEIWFGEFDTITTLTRPFAWVHLDTPPSDEAWVAAQDKRQGPFRVLVEIVVKPGDKKWPYGVSGDASKRGILTVAEDVANRLEANRTAILGANAKNVDLNVQIREATNQGEQSFRFVIVVSVTQRFTAAGR